ncbi:MAG: acetylxylan esterase [Pirellulales bacterium]|nr:acetylxylan esterase [Pirellulales bacterium]
MLSKPSLRLFSTTLLCLMLPAVALAASVKLDVNTEHPNAIYKMGEDVKFIVSISSDKKPVTTGTVRYVLNEDGLNKLGEGKVELGTKPAVITGRMAKPGFLRCTVYYRPKTVDGKKAPGAATAIAGAAISPEKIEPSMPVPDDFDEFWAARKKEVADMPMEPKLTPVDSGSPKMECFDVQINCPGGAPVSGYFGRPKDAKPKSLPAILWVHGAGVCSSRLGNAQKAMRLGMLSMDINAHGIPNGKPASYYTNLSNTDLQNYRHRGREDRNKVYFVGMFMRLIRAIDFLTAQPQWDGKTMIVVGHSQGGGQALAAGGLDDRVTFIASGVPAICDHSGGAIGRIAGWPKIVPNGPDGKPEPKALQACRYIDCVNLASRAKADAIMSVGFIDATCPATTCYAAYNQLQGKKQVINEPKMGHAAPNRIHAAFEKAFVEHAKKMSGK